MQPTHKSPAYREHPLGYSLSNKDAARLKALADSRKTGVAALTRAIVVGYLDNNEPCEAA